MARTIAPERPTPIEPVNVKIPDIDLTIFDKLGDQKIKSATQNFQLYATTTANAEAQKAYQKYKNNPIALANALSKLPGMFDDLPESVRNQLKPKLDSNAISLVTKAQANQEREINKQNKAMAHANAILNTNQISDDYFNVLRYITSPDEEKRPIDLAIYRQHRQQLSGLTAMTDENGNPLFTENQRAKMTMPKDATVAGFKNFINRMELEQLKEWDAAIFQNKDKFMTDTDIDSDTYESMETALTKRMKQLADTKVRTIHGQAYYDATNLITAPTQLNIEKAKAYKIIPEKTIDKLAENSKEATQATYYDPERPTAPAAFMQTYSAYGEIINKLSENPTVAEQNKVVEALAEAAGQLSLLAKGTNLPPEEVEKINASMKKALTDKLAAQTLADINFGGKLEQYRQTIDPSILQGPAVGKKAKQVQQILQDQQMIEKQEQVQKKRYNSALEEKTALAVRQYSIDVSNAIPYYLAGDYNTFKQAIAAADRRFDKTRASFIVKTETDWQRLENALAQGKPAMIEWEGRTLQFMGFDNRGAVFQERN